LLSHSNFGKIYAFYRINQHDPQTIIYRA